LRDMRRLYCAWRRPGLVLGTILLAMHAGARSGGAQERSARGVVLRGDSRDPLPYSTVAVLGTSIERFTDESGQFAITGLPSGNVTLRVRHIGYTPVDVPLTGDTVRVELQRIAVSLAGVRVDADRRCIEPARRDPAATDPSSVVINQLVENGRQYELITTKYPFVARMHQTYGYLGPQDTAERSAERIDVIRSDRDWHYQAGRVVERTARANQLHVPTIAVFAQEEFLRAHCFWLETPGTDSRAALKIEFRAAARISDPDLDGTIYLDPATFMIRRLVLRLANIARYSDEYDSVSVDTRFSELYPGVPIVTAIDGFDHYARPAASREGRTRLAFLERQRVVAIEFTRGAPGDTSRRSRSSVRHVLDRIVGVFDETSGKPIAGATVLDTISEQHVTTSITGTASLAFLLNDHAVLKIGAPGFTPVIVPTELSLHSLPPLTIVLRPAP
jgi:hypothetical protein